MTFLAIGTVFATVASANGCINDASRAWFGAIHPRYRTPFRAILFLVPVAIAFAVLPVPLSQPELLATFPGYGTTLLTLVVFYLLASIWFVLFRYEYVRRSQQVTMRLPRPKGH